MALHCYKEALETDPQCVCALYQSILVYRTLGNTQAEIQALRLLHSVSKTSKHHIRSEWSGRWQKMQINYTEKTLFQTIRVWSYFWRTDDALCHRIQPGRRSFLVSVLTVAQPVTEQPAVGSLCPLCSSLSGPEVCPPRQVRRAVRFCWLMQLLLKIQKNIFENDKQM